MGHAEEGKGIPGASHFDTAKRHMALAGRGERQGAKVQAGRQEAVNKPDLNAHRMNKGMGMGMGMMGGGLPVESTDKKNKRGLFNPDVDKVGGRGTIMGGMGMARSEKRGNLKKALSAGSGMAAPGNLVQGAALGKESMDKKMKKSNLLVRAEQEYSNWTKREEFENFMSKAMPHLTKSEIKVIGQTLCLNKSMKAEKELKKLMAQPTMESYIDKKEKK
jgi:hypothetical protein